ncbi:cytochrome P450 [Xylaria sp. CBS 124048]|nr:cytochrome P450 [Xylaria sp. CBS 124048]
MLPIADVNLYYLLWVFPLLFLYYYVVDVVHTWRSGKEYPVMWSPTALTPRFVLNFLFSVRAQKLCRDSYQRFKDRAIQFVRTDGNLLVLPYAVLDELSNLPPTVANVAGAIDQELLGQYTGLNVILENRLHSSIVQRRLTPRIPTLVPTLEKAVTAAFNEYFPKADGDGWTTITPFKIFVDIAARVNAPALVGTSFAEDPEWLEIAVEFTEQVMHTMVVLRMLPVFMHPIVARFLPSYWTGRRVVRNARKYLAPIVEKMLAESDSGAWDPINSTKEEDSNTLSWLAGSVKGAERKTEKLANTLLLLAFASTHTTLTRIANCLYDMTAADPAIWKEMAAEVESVAAEPQGWTDVPYDRLHKLDSLLRESQRISPTMLMGMKRLFKQPYTFQNGIHVPAGTFVGMLVQEIASDPDIIPNPEVFDPLRSYREKEKLGFDNPAAKEFNFTAATKTALGFGYGRLACPGRFFASLVIKMIFVKLFTEYEFKFMPGEGRPNILSLQDFLITSPHQQMMVRRTGGVCPF